MTMNWFDIIIRIGCFIAAFTFVVRYSRYRWEVTDEGQHLMAMTAVIAGFMALVLSFAIFGPGAWYIWLSRTFFVFLFLLLIQRNQLLTNAQNRETESRQDNPETYTSPVGQTIEEENQ
jgi:hypothetical protein